MAATDPPGRPRQPLSEPMFLILLVLGRGPLHGYGILQAIEEQTDGDVRLRTGTLYNAIGRLEERGLIEEVPDRGGERRRVHRLTRSGRRSLDDEARRVSRLARLAGELTAVGEAGS